MNTAQSNQLFAKTIAKKYKENKNCLFMLLLSIILVRVWMSNIATMLPKYLAGERGMLS